MDPAQFGGIKGNSITLSLILYYHFIASNLDNISKDKKSVIAAAAYVDLAKGFQNISHKIIITKLSDWGVPVWLIKIVASYLSKRTMVVNYGGAQSKPFDLPGSVAQGDELGLLLFLVAISDAGLPPAPPLPPPVLPGDVSSCVPPHPPPVTGEELRLKWVDNITLAETVKLDKCLQKKPIFIGPSNLQLNNQPLSEQKDTTLEPKLRV